MAINSKIEKYIYKFLIYLKDNNYSFASQKLKEKYKLNSNYVNSIVEECIKASYIDGIECINSISNFKHIIVREHVYVTRNGFIFLNQYQRNIINFFFIPLKNIIIIALTAFITSIFTAYILPIADFFKSLFNH